MVGFGNFQIGKFVNGKLNGMFVYSSSYSGCDGNEGIGFPSVVLYGVKQ